jgi:hypothetical protein
MAEDEMSKKAWIHHKNQRWEEFAYCKFTNNQKVRTVNPPS